MKLTMRLHSLTLPINARESEVRLHSVDDIKGRTESGWTNRLTLHGIYLKLGNIVIVTLEKEIARTSGTEPVTPPMHDEGHTENEPQEDAL